MGYSSLISYIQSRVYENDSQAISGTGLQEALLQMVASLGDGYQFKGVATPATNPGTPDQNVFYIASEVGTYSNFGLSVGENEVALFLWDGIWRKQNTGAASAEVVSQLGQQSDYLSNKDIGSYYKVGYLRGDGIWDNASTIHTIDKLYILPSDVILLTGVTNIAGMGFCVRGLKIDGTTFQYNYNSSYIVSLGGGNWKISLPDDVSQINYITISWLSSLQNVGVKRIDNGLNVQTRSQILTPSESKFVNNNLGLDKTDFIVDNDLVRKNTDKITFGAYIDGTTGQEVSDSSAAYIKIPITAGSPRIYFVVFDLSFSNTNYSYAFFDSSDTFLGGAVDTLNLPNIVGINNVKVRENTAYIIVNFEASHGIEKFRIFDTPDFYNNNFLNGNFSAVGVTNSEIVCSSFWDLFTRCIDRDGYSISASTLGTTRMIPCTEGEKYRISSWLSTLVPSQFSYTYVFFNSALTAISNGQGWTAEYEITVPENAKYVAFLYEVGASISIKKSVYSGSVKILSDALPNHGGNPNWDGKIWVGLGDSLTAQSPGYAGLSWSPDVEAKTGLVFKNCGVGSTCLAGNDSNAFWKRLTPVEEYNPDIVTILGGANDLYSDIPLGTKAEFDKTISNKDCTTFMGAYSYIVETLLSWKKTLRIVILTTSYAHSNGAAHTPGIGLTYADYANACKEVAHYYGLPVVDLYNNMGLNKITQDSTYTVGDNIHWNAAASQIVASLVISKLNEINNA